MKSCIIFLPYPFNILERKVKSFTYLMSAELEQREPQGLGVVSIKMI